MIDLFTRGPFWVRRIIQKIWSGPARDGSEGVARGLGGGRMHNRERTVGFAVVFGLAMLAFFAGAASAQLTGVVRASGGILLEGVAVEAWSVDRRLSAVLSDSDGSFSFPQNVAVRTVMLRAGALGFEVLEVPVVTGLSSYDLVLAEAPLVLEGLVVTREEAPCEMRRDDSKARALWENARSRYQGVMDTLGIATYLAEADTIVPIDKLGPLQLPTLNLSQRGSSSLLRFSWTRRIERDGYAFKVRRTDGGEPYDSWVYPPLEADFAPHFVDDLFGERHRFIVDDEREDGWSLAYCPEKDDKPGIRGIIDLARDTTFVSVEWIFQTPEPVEHAGGRALFSPLLADSEIAYFLPSEALTWRAVPEGDYVQRYQRYEGWLVSPGDSVPLLPLRRNDPR